MKKILITATEDSHIKLFHIKFLKFFKENGYETHVATNSSNSIDYCDVKHKISIERSPFNIKNIFAIKQLRKIVNREKFDIIHTHTPMGSVVTRLASNKQRKKGTKVIYTAHGFHFFEGAPMINWLIYYPIEKFLSRFTDDIITINLEDYNLALRKLKSTTTNVYYIPGVGINKDKIKKDISDEIKNKFKANLGIQSNDYVLIFPARLDKNKNQRLLIDVMKLLIKDIKNVCLLLPGRDELDGEYQEYARKLGLDKHIHFLGFREDIPNLLAISDIALSSSLREGLPVNIMEGLASGLPIVALNCRGMKDIVTDGENGYLLDINSSELIEKFSEKIIRIISDGELRNKMSSKNIKKSESYYFENILDRYVNVYFNK